MPNLSVYIAILNLGGTMLRIRAFILASATALGALGAAVPSSAADKLPIDVQRALLEGGFNPGIVDGVWGKRSSNALRAFQKSRGLMPTGVIDDQSIELLFPEEVRKQELSPAITEPATSVATPSKASVPADAPVERRSLPSPVNEKPLEKGARPGANEPRSTPPNVTAAEPTLEVSAPPAVPPTSRSENHWGLPVLLGALGLFALVRYIRKRSKWRRAEELLKATAKPIEAEPTPATPQIPYVHPTDASGSAEVLAVGNLATKAPSTYKPSSSVPRITPVAATATASTVPLDKPAKPEDLDTPVLLEMRAKRAERETVSGLVFDIEMVPVRSTLPETPFTIVVKPIPTTRTETASVSTRNPGLSTDTIRAPEPTRGDPWLPAGKTTTVGTVAITGGMIYVGGFLPKRGAAYQNENCLINPKLTVGRHGDPAGHSLYYWPSYSDLSPEARRSYLEWLAGTRSEPEVNIGYVFLYFYGLERRLMLEAGSADEGQVVAEVRRLLAIYGGNHSFSRYANELLSAVMLRAGEPSDEGIRLVETTSYEVPTTIKLALGMRVKEGREIEPGLLLRFVMSHPETRVRTPAKRATELLEKLFSMRLVAMHPNGLRVKAGRYKKIKKRYHACSGTFEVDVPVFGGDIPDITDRAEPITTGRMLFDECSGLLDDYSRAIGKLPGLQPNLAAVAKLPNEVRTDCALALPGNPLQRLSALVAQTRPVLLSEVAAIASIDLGASPSRPKVKELAQVLSTFGFGITCDPRYAPKTPTIGEQLVVFNNSGELADEAGPTYRTMQLAVMLGMIVAHADGHFHETEREALLARVAAAEITDGERTRLRAEIALHEADPSRLDDWMKRLKDVPLHARETIADELIAAAVADGNLHADEVKKLEQLFKRMGLDGNGLYHRLHGNLPAAGRFTDDDPSLVVAPGASVPGTPIPSPPEEKKSIRIDLAALKSIRSETRVTASVLADIFADEEEPASVPEPSQPSSADSDDELFDGLERRYGALLLELSSRPTWTKDEFEQFVREAGLMPGAAREAINDWSLDHFDELLIEGEGPVEIHTYLLSPSAAAANLQQTLEGTNT